MAAITWLLLVTWLLTPSHGNHFAKKLYDDLLRKSGYNRIIRPVQNDSDVIIVTIGLKLSQLIDVDEKNQFMTTNVWVNQEWHDSSLTWDPDEYGSVNMLYVPARDIWHPDIVLYNNADGKYEMTPDTKATIYHDGRVRWQPPASFKSSCNIDVTYFPFDEQKCDMKFGSWTYNRYEVEMLHSWQQLNSSMGQLEFPKLTVGVDLKAFYKNVEWDLMAAPAHKSTIYYAGAEDPYSEWTFSVRLKRKFLFYTVNLIIPLVSHAFMTILVFYLPADSKEKISLSINILLSMTVFFLLLAEIIPPTSIVVPLLAKYLIFTMFLVVASVIVTVFTYNIHFRSLATHTMPDWMRKVFLYWLPRLLMMRRPKIENAHDVELKHIKLKLCGCLDAEHDHRGGGHGHGGGGGGYSASRQRMNAFEMRYQFGSKRTRTQAELMKLSRELDEDTTSEAYSNMCPEVKNAIEGAIFIANHLKEEDEFNRTKEDWKYIALVIDRLFLYLYLAICVFGTIGIIAGAPMLYDRSIPIVFDQSQAGTATPTHTTVIGTT